MYYNLVIEFYNAFLCLSELPKSNFMIKNNTGAE